MATLLHTHSTVCPDLDGGLICRNIYIHGRRTSVKLEIEMWAALAEVATRERITIHELCSRIRENLRPNATLTSQIRSYLVVYYRRLAANS